MNVIFSLKNLNIILDKKFGNLYGCFKYNIKNNCILYNLEWINNKGNFPALSVSKIFMVIESNLQTSLRAANSISMFIE